MNVSLFYLFTLPSFFFAYVATLVSRMCTFPFLLFKNCIFSKMTLNPTRCQKVSFAALSALPDAIVRCQAVL